MAPSSYFFREWIWLMHDNALIQKEADYCMTRSGFRRNRTNAWQGQDSKGSFLMHDKAWIQEETRPGLRRKLPGAWQDSRGSWLLDDEAMKLPSAWQGLDSNEESERKRKYIFAWMKGSLIRDCPSVFFTNQIPPCPWYPSGAISNFYRICKYV
jgi:hypothetical protein